MGLFPRQTDIPPDGQLPDIPLPSVDPPVVPSDPPPPSESSSTPPSSSERIALLLLLRVQYHPAQLSVPPSSSQPPPSSSAPPPPHRQAALPVHNHQDHPRQLPPDSSTLEPTPSESATEQPLSESSASESLTVVTTTSNGVLTTFTTQVTALVNASNSGSGEVHRTAMIAGLTTGLVVLLAIILGGVFAYRRQARRRALNALAEQKREKESKNLLDSEGFDDDVGSYHQQTMRSHFSIGSNQRNVWPPPQSEMVDPIQHNSSQVNLGTIVDDVMGPTGRDAHKRLTTESTVNSTSGLIVHDRSSSSASSEYYQYSDPFQARPVAVSHFPPTK
ncbi:hypothetical protein BKA70DRAFT_1443211 [Coprinopsis sp. MPI-PUGE-AT-0042]|nr:hypothetical protein BKA70DRAFT_1443211 [Coprinopsis sp. MPI-PUGE-AT-0042]